MSQYTQNIIVECNRNRAKSNFAQISEAEDTFKNRWTNNVSSTGIEVDIGDVIQLEAGCINSKGANEGVIEFIGDTETGVDDTRMAVKFGYYVNHTGRNTAVLPLKNQLIDDGNGNTFDYSNMCNRNVGQFPRNPTDNQYNQMSPQGGVRFTFKLTSYGTDYEAGKYYREVLRNPPNTNPPTIWTGENLIIQVISVRSEGNDAGIIDEFVVINEGINFNATGGNNDIFENPIGIDFRDECDVAGNIIQSPRSGHSGQQPNDALGEVYGIIQENFFSKTKRFPDGERYYLPSPTYTGMGLFDWDTTNPDDNLDQLYDIRTSTAQLQVPVGFNTPDNVGEVLTDILHEPKKLTKIDNKDDFIDLDNYTIESAYQPVGGVQRENLPVIVATPTFKPTGANGFPYTMASSVDPALPIPDATYRNAYYNCVGYADPLRFKALQPFKNFIYKQENTDPANWINTGAGVLPNLGDYGNQDVGLLGLRVCILNDLPSQQDYCQFTRGRLLLTNMYFNEDTISALASGFKDIERYLGGDTNVPDAGNIKGSKDYRDNAGVFLDLGQYDDQRSFGVGYNYVELQSAGLDGNAVGRKILGSYDQHVRNGNNWSIDTSEYDLPAGQAQFIQDTLPDGKMNDGSQLGGLYVRSRWSDDFLPNNLEDPSIIPYPNGVDYQALFDEISDANYPNAQPAQTGFRPPPADQEPIRMFKSNGYNSAPNPYAPDTYADAIALAKKYDIACIPVWERDPTSFFYNFENKPYIAFVSAVNVDIPATPSNPVSNPLDDNGTAWNYDLNWGDQNWILNRRLNGYGTPFGFDTSMLRNKAVLFYNLQSQDGTAYDSKIPQNYANLGMIGGVNPSVKYNPIAGRFEINGLNSAMTIGNPMLQTPNQTIEPSDDPEQAVYNVGVVGMIQPFYDTLANPNTNFPNLNQGSYFASLGTRQNPSAIIGSQSGVCILDLLVYNSRGGDEYSLTTYPDKYQNSLFAKMGFSLTQLLPDFGSVQTFFTNNLEFIETGSNYNKLYQNSKPMTTGMYISSAEYQPLSTNQKDNPLYDLGISFFRSARPNVEFASITAFNLPDKLNYPYLCIYSDIAVAGCDTTYYGGSDSQSKIPCMAFMTRNYNNGDFFYALESTFNYTATKPFVITDITTDIRLPDGSRPILDPHSAVIYKIIKSAFLAIPPEIISKQNNNERQRREARRGVLRKATA
jgi:hypothetical protein